MKALLVYITAPDPESARSMVARLVEERLCACANILGPVESLYWWKGRVENSREAALICKTTQSGYPAFEKRARELHPYDTPCIVALPLTEGFPPFLQWIAEETRS